MQGVQGDEESMKSMNTNMNMNIDMNMNMDASNTRTAAVERILRGEFLSYDSLLKDWMPLRSKLLVFVSSTFTDTNRERNILFESILPDIRAEGRRHGIDVAFVDMRWGVRDENTLDHRTWDECVRELDRCYEESAGIFFLSLQADKYGYVPLPRVVDKIELEAKMAAMCGETLALTQSWYQLDENSIPARYVLRSLKELRERDYWEITLPVLTKELDGVIFDKRLYPQLTVGQSMTHWEVLAALEKVKNDAGSRLMWCYRHFIDSVKLHMDPSK
jgi:hypothetical protein